MSAFHKMESMRVYNSIIEARLSQLDPAELKQSESRGDAVDTIESAWDRTPPAVEARS